MGLGVDSQAGWLTPTPGKAEPPPSWGLHSFPWGISSGLLGLPRSVAAGFRALVIQVLAGVAGSLRAGPGVLNPDTFAPSDQTDTLSKSLQPPWPRRPSRQRSAPVLAESPACPALLLGTHRTTAAAVPLVSRVRLSVISRTAARQASLSLTVSPSFPGLTVVTQVRNGIGFLQQGVLVISRTEQAAGGGWIQARTSWGHVPPPVGTPPHQDRRIGSRTIPEEAFAAALAAFVDCT